jgi:hypothetical protein
MKSSWLALVAIAVSGCGAATGIDNTIALADHYELATYDGAALPVTTRRIVSIPATPGDATGWSCDDRITGQQLLFGPSDQVRQITQRGLFCDKTQHNQVSADTLSGRVTANGNDVSTSFTGAGYLPTTVHALVVGGELRIDLVSTGSPPTMFDRTPREFRRGA